MILKGCYDSVDRAKMFKVMRHELGPSCFLDNYEELLSKLLMDIDCGWASVDGIRSFCGLLQGSSVSCTCINLIVKHILPDNVSSTLN